MIKTQIGGELFIDQFCAQRRVPAKPKPAQAPAPAPAAVVAQPAQTVAPIPVSITPDESLSDTGRIRAEVEAFMNRDQLDGADNSEVQEFLKERSGFDPSEIG